MIPSCLPPTAFSLIFVEEETEANLWARRDFDPLAVRELARRYIEFARRVVRSYVHHRKVPGRYPLDELLSAGHVGLMSAVRRFDPERGWKFETFAARRIRGAVKDELRSNPPPVAGDGTENEDRVCPYAVQREERRTNEQLERVRGAWLELDARARAVLDLTVMRQIEIPEAARLMRMSERTLHDLRRAAIRRLREVLDISEDER